MATKKFDVIAYNRDNAVVVFTEPDTNESAPLVACESGITNARDRATSYMTHADDASYVGIFDNKGNVVEHWKRNNYTGAWFQRKVG